MLTQANTEATAYITAVLSSPRQMAAALAGAVGITLIVVGAFTRTMLPLRWLVLGSGCCMLLFGLLHPSKITLLVAAALLPINLYRAFEVTRLTRRVQRAQADADLAGLWLKPYMRRRRMRAGQALFLKGDRANRLYLLLDGEIELADIGKRLEPGRIFGEIALFSPSGLRTHTARCVTACLLLEINERTVKQLFYQNPSFGFHLIELLAGRLSADIERTEAQLAVTRPRAAS